jgi:hypothetical protein
LYLGRAGSRSRKPLNFHKKVSKQHRQQKRRRAPVCGNPRNCLEARSALGVTWRRER